MEYLVGVLLALGVGLFATIGGLDRERGFYPVVLTVVASYYMLFAVISGAPGALTVEALVFCAFAAVAVVGFRWNLWLVVAALAAHGGFDLIHPHVVSNPGTPAWWPAFCLAYDVAAAGYLAVRLLTGRARAGA